MNPNTHEEYLQNEEGKTIAIITGVPDTCNHFYDDKVYILGNGVVLLEKDFRCPTDEETQKYLQKEVDKQNSFIETGTTRCVKCKKIYSPDLFMI